MGNSAGFCNSSTKIVFQENDVGKTEWKTSDNSCSIISIDNGRGLSLFRSGFTRESSRVDLKAVKLSPFNKAFESLRYDVYAVD